MERPARLELDRLESATTLKDLAASPSAGIAAGTTVTGIITGTDLSKKYRD